MPDDPRQDWHIAPRPTLVDRKPYLARLAAADGDEAKAEVLIDAAGMLPPWELKRLYARMRKDMGHGGVPALLIRKAVLWQRLKNRDARHYKTIEYGPCVTLYRVMPRPARPGLLICFAGKGNQVFALTSRLIHAIDHPDLDIVLIRHMPLFDFRSGVPGFGYNVHLIGAGLERSLKLSSYAHVGTMGVSMGALPALALARQLNAAIGLSICARYPGMVEPTPLARAGTAFDAICACPPPASRQAVALFGALNPEDAGAALRLGTIAPGIAQLPIADLVDHNAIAYLNMRRKLGAFFALLADTILDDAPFAERFRAEILPETAQPA